MRSTWILIGLAAFSWTSCVPSSGQLRAQIGSPDASPDGRSSPRADDSRISDPTGVGHDAATNGVDTAVNGVDAATNRPDATDAQPRDSSQSADGRAPSDTRTTGSLRPLYVQLDTVRFHHDFEVPGPLDPNIWFPRIGTRWSIEGGVLKGLPATAEYQAQYEVGVRPRIDAENLGDDYAIDLKFKLEGGTFDGQVALDFEHHILMLRLLRQTTTVYDYVRRTTLKTSTFVVQPGRWYHILAEVKGDTFVVQFEGGPTMYAQTPDLIRPRGVFRIDGSNQGTAYLDDVTAWRVKPEPQPTWPATRATLP